MSEHSDAGATAFQLTLRTSDGVGEPEIWRARIHPGGVDVSGEEHWLAEAIVYRVHYSNPRWAEQLRDAEVDLTSIGSAFVDRELISMLDESSLFTDNLCIISSVDVDDAADGPSMSHDLVRSIARVFDGDTIALLTTRPADARDPAGSRAGHAHWAEIGFVDIPGTTSMILPVGSRS